MTAPTLDAEPACPGLAEASAPPTQSTRLRAEPRDFDSLDPATWDALAARQPWATPFSAWAFHRAWWDGYGANAHEETMVVLDDAGTVVAIAPLMHRHEVEPSDELTSTTIRHRGDRLRPVNPMARAVFFGASYHADYATLLAAPDDLPAVADALADYFATEGSGEWDVLDLRRLRCGDPAADALAEAFRADAASRRWTVDVEREDVCPVVTFPEGVDVEGYVATLGKKERHEVRRKLRRAEAVGEVRLDPSPDPLAHLDEFIDLHQKRWGADGLFPPTPGGEQSRVFLRRLFELFGDDGPLQLSFLSVGGRRIGAGIHLETADTILYYNAGIDPDARELSPGVLMVHGYVARALATGKRRLDFLRGNEGYKYEWGAVDEPIQRVLLGRRA
jgi:CelD/BcsL family acetyltransferase involved in cellulose biosynthesis